MEIVNVLDESCELCFNREKLPICAIPCLHVMFSRLTHLKEFEAIVKLEDIGSRWMRKELPLAPLNNINQNKTYKTKS